MKCDKFNSWDDSIWIGTSCLVCSLNIEEIFHLTYDRVNGGEPLVVKLSIFHSPARPDRRGEGVFALAWLVSWHLVRLLQLFPPPSHHTSTSVRLGHSGRIGYWWSHGHLVSCCSTNTFLVYLVDKDKCVVLAFSHLQSAKHGTINAARESQIARFASQTDLHYNSRTNYFLIWPPVSGLADRY